MVSMNKIEQVAKKIGDSIHAEKIILFGSYASDTAKEDSDVDLLVIAESHLTPYQRATSVYRLFRPHPFSMDILIYTPKEVDRHTKHPLSFLSQVLKEGKVIYEQCA